MNMAALRKFCATLPGATRDIKWEGHQCFSVGGKMFAMFPLPGENVGNISFKCAPERFLELTDVAGVIPAPYLARAHWIQVGDAPTLRDDELRTLLADSHGLVVRRLTRKAQTQILGAPVTSTARAGKRT